MSDENSEYKFLCPSCNFTAQVAGKRYYELEWQFHIGTRVCKSCHRLFDNVVTKNVTEEEFDAHKAGYNSDFKNEKGESFWDEINQYALFLETIDGKEKKKVICRWCGLSENEVWHKENPVCPKCNSQMSISEGEAIQSNKIEQFANIKEMINSTPQVVAFFTEPTCGICRNLQLVIAEIKIEYPDEFHFVEFDYIYAEENELISKYKLKYFPTFLHFKNGRYVGKFSNVETKPELLKKIRKRFEKN